MEASMGSTIKKKANRGNLHTSFMQNNTGYDPGNRRFCLSQSRYSLKTISIYLENKFLLFLKNIGFAIFLAVCFFPFSGYIHPADASEKATPGECVEKCRQARDYLSKNAQKGKEALEEALLYMNRKDNRFTWKDTYVYVTCCDCPFLKVVAHPIKPKLVGPDLSGIKDKTGKLFFLHICEAAQKPLGGWLEYWWPKVGEKKASRKLTFVLDVPGTGYQVAAGIYDETLKIEELNARLEKK